MLLDAPPGQLPLGLTATSGILPEQLAGGRPLAGVGWQALGDHPLCPEALAAKAQGMKSWKDFASEVAQFGTPLTRERRQLPAFVSTAIQRRASMPGAAIAAFRSEQQAKILRISELHHDEPTPRWALLQKLALAAGVGDLALQQDGTQGFLMHGTLPPCGQWPSKLDADSVADTTVHQAVRKLLAEHRDLRVTGHTRGFPGTWPLPGRHEALLLSQLREGTSKGWWRELSPDQATERLGDYLAWLYFGVEQEKDSGEIAIRGCLAPDGVNALTTQPEKIYMAGVDGIAAAGRALRAALDPSQCICMAREDWRSGFYQLPIHPSSARLLCAAAWDPDLGVRVFCPRRLGFGGAGAPYQFCRVATAALQILSAMFWVPALPHVDDDIMLDTPEAMPSARAAHVVLYSALGVQLSRQKAVPPREEPICLRSLSLGTGVQHGVALGVEWSWATPPCPQQTGVCAWVRLPDRKSAKYNRKISAILLRGK